MESVVDIPGISGAMSRNVTSGSPKRFQECGTDHREVYRGALTHLIATRGR